MFTSPQGYNVLYGQMMMQVQSADALASLTCIYLNAMLM